MERKITIEETTAYHEDYQMRMLQANEIEGLLPVRGRGIDGSSFYDYNVSGKISMQAMYERNKISGEDLKIFLRQLLTVIRETENYLLNIHCILLEPEFIFYEDGAYYFCYYPKAKQDLWDRVHKLTEYFVKQADYEDKESVRIVFILHKETMSENYNLEKIVRDCMKEEKKHEDKEDVRSRELYDEEAEDENGHYDWTGRQDQGNLIMEETENMWTPVKRFLNRRKKPKWGDWDGLYIEEEEL